MKRNNSVYPAHNFRVTQRERVGVKRETDRERETETEREKTSEMPNSSTN
jgi:hypothetical protein